MIANPNDGNSPQVEVATPTISVSAGGLITATTQQGKGYVPGGSKSAIQQLTTQGAKTVTPTTTEQIAVASGLYTTGDVKVAGDANLVAENIAEGVSIFGVTGTHSGGEFQTCIGQIASWGIMAYYVFLNAEGELEASTAPVGNYSAMHIVIGSIITFNTTAKVSGGLIQIDTLRYRVTGDFAASAASGPPG